MFSHWYRIIIVTYSLGNQTSTIKLALHPALAGHYHCEVVIPQLKNRFPEMNSKISGNFTAFPEIKTNTYGVLSVVFYRENKNNETCLLHILCILFGSLFSYPQISGNYLILEKFFDKTKIFWIFGKLGNSGNTAVMWLEDVAWINDMVQGLHNTHHAYNKQIMLQLQPSKGMVV